MNEVAKTLLFAGGAAALVMLATVSRPGGEENVFFSDQGQLFFAGFTEPSQATDLEVWSFDEERGEMMPFKVRQGDKGLWTIESHSNYPADAKDRMAKAASSLIGLRKDNVVSDESDLHPKFGVVDPREESLDLKGRGKRITFKDKAGSVLGDLIVGKELENKMDVYYVRVPATKRVYTAKFPAELSTKFEDWIERDLMQVTGVDINSVLFDNYKVDEQAGDIVAGEKIAAKKDDASKWTLDGMAASEEVNSTRMQEVTDTLDQLKIVGVRKKPDGLSEALEAAQTLDPQVRRQLQLLLQSKGYFLSSRGNKVYSNDGDLVFSDARGITYTLRFGEIVYGSGLAVSSGSEEAKQPEAGAEGPKPMEGNHRFLMVTASFDEKLLPAPRGPKIAQDVLDKRRAAREQVEAIVNAIEAWKAKNENKLPPTLAALTEGAEPAMKELKKDPWDTDYAYAVTGETFVVKSFGEDKAEGGEAGAADIASDALAREDEFTMAAADWKSHEQKVADGRKAAGSLQKRFGPWYYVIDAESFAKLRPARKDLVQEKKAEAAAAPGGDASEIPGMPLIPVTPVPPVDPAKQEEPVKQETPAPQPGSGGGNGG